MTKQEIKELIEIKKNAIVAEIADAEKSKQWHLAAELQPRLNIYNDILNLFK